MLESNKKLDIIKATQSSIKRRGYNSFSMQEVAKEAGVSKGIIHYYFLNKDDLMLAVFEEWSLEMLKGLGQKLANTQEPKDKLKDFCSYYFDSLVKHREIFQILIDFLSKKEEKAAIALVLQKHYQAFHHICASVVEEGIQNNQFRKVDSHAFSRMLAAFLDGIHMQAFLDPEATSLPGLAIMMQDMFLSNLLIGT